MTDERRHRDNVPAARRLRREMTYPERVLWELLRDRALDQWKFRRQHPVGANVLDFYCPQAMLAIEIDGAMHLDADHARRDVERQAVLEAAGVRFLRISAAELLRSRQRAVQTIREALERR